MLTDALERTQKDAEAQGLFDDFVNRIGLGTSEWAEAGEGLAAVEVGVVGVDAGQGQGRVAAGRSVLFVAGRRVIGRDLR